jgi:hypothetical protein
MNVEIGLSLRNSFSGNICFEFSVLSLCSAGAPQYVVPILTWPGQGGL